MTTPTQQQIADAVGLSRSRTTEIVGEMSATTAPKLLNHGGKREGRGDYNHVERGTTGKDYITARLKRAASTGPDSAGIGTPETQTRQLVKF